MRMGLGEFAWRLSLLVIVGSLGITTMYVVYSSHHAIEQTSQLFVWGAWASVQLLVFCVTAAHALDGFLSTNTAHIKRSEVTGKVSIHVPIHCEPPQIVSETLRCLAELESESFEVIVVDNNTADQALWRPIEDLSRQLGFKFFHLERWPGYKAGALNFAASVTSSDADFIAVLDADYLVQRDFLSQMMPYFRDPAVAFVQAPQDYRYSPGSLYQRWTFLAYRYFFDVSMAAHKRMNSAIFVGTMGIIRKSVLIGCGGWDERCLTEDAEIALRVAADGHLGVFVNTSYGKGLMPLDYVSFRRQRYRWAFGGAQMLKKYWSHVFWIPQDPESGGFTIAQRLGFGFFFLYWFEAWLAVGTACLFWLMAFLSCVAPDLCSSAVPANCAVLLIVTLAARTALFVGSLARRSQCTFAEAWGAFLILGGVNWLVSRACMKALQSRLAVFERTPKDQRGQETLVRKLRFIKTELTMAVFGFWAACVPLFAGITEITVPYSIGCLWGCLMFSLPLVALVIDHAQQGSTTMGPSVSQPNRDAKVVLT
jgi:cellulose synthase/poly-beta-1,6-N-acetylglucosamine synthase-like glycosyltransferase